MAIQVYEVGQERSRVAVIDDFLADPDALVRQAAALAPYPRVADNSYPGLRRFIVPEDGVFAYVDAICGALSPVLRQVWGVERFRITEASFSMVTQRPEETQLIQRVPHYDSLDPTDFAVLLYLNPDIEGGTAFYRHRRSGFERMSETRKADFIKALDEDLDRFGTPPESYIDQSTIAWERIGEVGWRYNRLAIYQGVLFHSGLIPNGFDYSDDPLRGRLTANIFLKATQAMPGAL